MSAPSSPRAPLQRRLSSRRGSMSAPDPFALNQISDGESERALTSRLTIVRVPSATANAGVQSAVSTPPDSPVMGRRNSWQARRSSGSSLGEGPGGKARLSFAFSTFTPITPPPGSIEAGVGRPATKQRTHSSGSASVPFAGRKNLTAEQLLEVAQHPVGSTPAVSSESTTNEYGFEPAPFEPLAADIWLPFLDRPKEVAALIDSPPTKQLFTVICQALPTSPAGDDHPATWDVAQLTAHLTEVTRDSIDDRAWVGSIRTCVTSHSELLWERFKGALGVPPELDEDPLLDDYEYMDSPGGPGAVEDTAVDDEYDESLPGSIEAEEEAWVEPIYDPVDLGAQLPLSSPRPEGASDLEAIGEREEELANAAGANKKPEPIQGIRIYTSSVAAPFPSRRSYSHSQPHSDFNLAGSGSASGGSSPNPGGSPLGRSQSLNDARRRFSSAIHLTQAGSSGLSGAGPGLGRSKSVQHGRRGVGALGGVGAGSGGGMVAPHTERSPGNPLFVSSFATLSAGPTLIANNPSLRYAHASQYVPRVPSRLGRGSDYAVSARSESERDFAG